VKAEGAGARVTVVIPAHNEAPVIGDVARAAALDIAARLSGTEIVVVDDGSSDGTAAVAAAVPGVQVLRLDRNLGQGPALQRGFASRRAEWICQMDGDGQVVPADFWKLWEHRDDADLVLGVRRRRCDPLHRRVLTRIVRHATGAAAGRRLEDAAAPLRLIRRSLWEDVRRFVDDDAIALSILVSVAASRRGWRVAEIPVHHRRRSHGASHLRRVRLLCFLVRGSVELTTLSMRLREGRPVPSPPPLAEA
jgi:dolichol-phosphate mannosyltransferase